MTNTLPVRYRPELGESLKGYMLRLTYGNGYEALSTLHSIMGHSLRPNYDGNIHSVLEALAPLVILDSATLAAYFDFDSQISADSKRAIVDIRVQYPRICPECMKEESAHINESWQHAHVTHCAKHQIELLTNCPHCRTSLSWSACLFEGCTHNECDFTWESYDAQPIELPRYLQATDLLVGHEKISFLEMLYQAFVYVIRPLDLTFDDYRTMPRDLDNLSEKFESAYRLLCDESFCDMWIDERNQSFLKLFGSNSYFSKHLDKLHPEIISLQNINWLPEPDSSALLLSHESKNAVAKQRTKHLQDVSDARRQLKLEDVSRILDMSRTTIVYLTHQKVLSPINSPKTTNYMLFDIKEVSRFTTKLSSEPSVISTSHAEKKVSIESLIDKISLFDIEDRYDLGILIEVIVKSDIPRSIEENTSLSITSLLFDRDLLLEELEVAFINSIQKEYSKVKIGKVCRLNEAQYFAFRELLGQDTALREGQHRYISHNALRDFFESHILINRWCLIRDLDIDDVVAKLNDSKISFAYPSLLKHGIFIIPKSSSHLL